MDNGRGFFFPVGDYISNEYLNLLRFGFLKNSKKNFSSTSPRMSLDDLNFEVLFIDSKNRYNINFGFSHRIWASFDTEFTTITTRYNLCQNNNKTLLLLFGFFNREAKSVIGLAAVTSLVHQYVNYQFWLKNSDDSQVKAFGTHGQCFTIKPMFLINENSNSFLSSHGEIRCNSGHFVDLNIFYTILERILSRNSEIFSGQDVLIQGYFRSLQNFLYSKTKKRKNISKDSNQPGIKRYFSALQAK